MRPPRKRPESLTWVERTLGRGARVVATEAAVLTALERSDVPAPRLVASTSDAGAGGPALLMTRVPGRVCPVKTWQ